MSDSLIANGYNAGIGVVDNGTRFMSVGNSWFGVTTNSTEARVEVPLRDAGDVKNFYTYVPTNTASVSSTITVRQSAADTTLLVTYTSDQTGLKQDSDSVAYAATDEIDFEVTVPTEVGTNTITISQMAVQFTPTTSSDCVSLLNCGGALVTISSASTNYYLPPSGGNANVASTENNNKYRIRGTFVAQDLSSYVSSNSRTTNTVFRTRKNGANGSQSVTYTSTQTGLKEDSSNTDSLSAGDDYCYQIATSTGTQNLVFTRVSSTLVNTSNQFIMLSGYATNVNHGSNITNYIPCGGHPAGGTTEANSQTLPAFTFTAKEMGMYVPSNSSGGTTVVVLRVSAADSSLTFSYTTGQTGLKEDTTNTATITGGTDEINFKVVTPVDAGSIFYTWIGLMGETTTATTTIKTWLGLADASTKTFDSLARASVKTFDGLA